MTTCSCLKIGSPIPATESKFKLRKAEESNLKVQANLRDIKSANVELRRNVKEIEQIVARQAQVESQIMAKVGRLK
ncbi:MAG: hypothetical protein IT291_11155 [Deltaproteobacteria bacterium]|nr:hypothetical protein [Deltaproteobacteria bacterium]